MPKTGGRQKGSANKLSSDIKAMILGALSAKGGQAYFEQQADKNPAAFMALVGKILPTMLTGDPNAPVHTVSRIELVAVVPQPRPIAAALAGTVAAAELADN
jgi:hypothetical protein